MWFLIKKSGRARIRSTELLHGRPTCYWLSYPAIIYICDDASFLYKLLFFLRGGWCWFAKIGSDILKMSFKHTSTLLSWSCRYKLLCCWRNTHYALFTSCLFIIFHMKLGYFTAIFVIEYNFLPLTVKYARYIHHQKWRDRTLYW